VHFVRQTFTKADANLAYAFSFWVKPNGRDVRVIVASDTNATNSVVATYNLSTGVASSVSATGSGWTAGVASLTSYASGWYRAVITGTSATGTGLYTFIEHLSGASFNYLGDGASGLYLWGAQLEQASFPSSYIPTTTASVARAGDICERTFGSEYIKTAGTCYVELTPKDVSATYGIFSQDANSRHCYIASTPSIRGYDGTTVVSASVAPAAGTLIRYAHAFDANGQAVTANGAAVATGAFDGSWGAASTISIGELASDHTSPMFGHIRRLSYWPERKSNLFLSRVTQLGLKAALPMAA